jgi:acetyl-CoA carboxylase carboxyl transferase subunit beta
VGDPGVGLPHEDLGQGPAAHFFDSGVYEILPNPEVPVDPLKFRDQKKYTDRLRENKNKTGLDDSIVNALGSIEGLPIVACLHDFNFMGGSLGIAAGEAIIKGFRRRSRKSARWCCSRLPAVHACRKASCR